MSGVPLETQLIKQPFNSQANGDDTRIAFLHTKNITSRQRDLLKECADFLEDSYGSKSIVYPLKEDDIKREQAPLRCFVIPSIVDSKLIEKKFSRTRIFLPRSILDMRSLNLSCLPVGRLLVSLSMYSCKVFLVRSCNNAQNKDKIFQMKGSIATKMSEANVVVTDRSDRNLKTARNLGIPIVDQEWISDSYNKSLNEFDDSHYNAKEAIPQFTIKPFHKLTFKIAHSLDETEFVKEIILENGGLLSYGNEKENLDLYHICDEFDTKEYKNRVNLSYLLKCVEAKTYIPLDEYKKMIEKDIQCLDQSEIENDESVANQCSNANEFKVPPVLGTQIRYGILNDWYMKSLDDEASMQSSISTQVRDIKDPEYSFERAVEPSQMLFWQDKKKS